MKARVLEVGTVVDDSIVSGFKFDCLGSDTPAISYNFKTGKILLCGYTIEELKQMQNNKEDSNE